MNVKGVFSHLSDDWASPKPIYDFYVKKLGYFDPCPLHSDFDGLNVEWPRNVFCNPPYSDIERFIDKGIECWRRYKGDVVFLLPFRTDTKWFQSVSHFGCDIRFIRGRLRFGSSKNFAPFPSMILKIDGYCNGFSGTHNNEFYVIDRDFYK